MPLDPKPSTPDQDPRLLDLQIDPYMGAALYRLLQGTAPTGEPYEVGFAYVTGSSRLDAVEHWFLYASVDDLGVRANKRAYAWPSGTEQPTGLQFQFVRVDQALSPSCYKADIENGGIRVVYIKATCTTGL